MKYRKLFFAALLACSFSAMADQSSAEIQKTKPDTHEGIQITVNINTASAEEISTLLKGIGLKKAERIVEFRTENGNFKAIEDLQKVKGIGAVIVNKNRERILL